VEMDKVAQQTAASAEESASAAEELNAQAEQMKSYVVDLIMLIGGGEQGGATGPVRRQALIRKVQARSKSSKSKSLVKHQSHVGISSGRDQVVRPDQIIPLEDGDFKDF